MTGTLHDARLAVRFLIRNRAFALAAIGILGMGISLTASLYAIIRGTLIEPWPYRGYDRLVTVRRTFPTQGRDDFSLWSVPEIEDLRRETNVFEAVVAGDARNANLLYAGRPERVRAAILTPNAFRALGVPALLGRTLADADAAADAPPAVVVNYRFWQTRLGADPRVVGQTLRGADATYTIAGVMPERFVFWDRDLWMPLRLDPQDRRNERRYYVQAMLRPGITLDAADTALRALSSRMAIDHPDRPEYEGSSIALGFLVQDVLRDLRPTLLVLLAAVALVLAVSTANLANAMLAKGLSRESELAIRRAIGGSSAQLARQLLVESAILGVAGGLTGAAGAAFLLPQIVALIPFGYVPAEAHVAIDWRVVVAAAGCATACGLCVGLVPALRASRIDPAILLRHGDARTGSLRTHWWRNAFIVAQLALAVVVVGVGVAATASLRAAVERDPGFRTRGIWTARIALSSASVTPVGSAAVYDRILQRLGEHPAVRDAAMATSFPTGPQPTMLVSAEVADAARRRASLDASAVSVSPGFFALLQIPRLAGRLFTGDDDPAHGAVAVVSRGLARRLWPDGRAVGSRITLGESGTTTATVVGVVGDVVSDGSDAAVRPSIFLPLAQAPPSAVVVGLETIAGSSALAIVTDAVHAVDASIPVYSPDTLERQRLATLGPKLLAVTLLGIFAAAVLAVSSAGIHAVVSQSVQERRQELRIRLTFGADRGQLFRGELARVGRLAALGAFMGTAAAAVALRLLAGWFAGFAAGAGFSLVASAATLFALALLTTARPAWRACHTALN